MSITDRAPVNKCSQYVDLENPGCAISPEFDFFLCHHHGDTAQAQRILAAMEDGGQLRGFYIPRDGPPNISEGQILENAITRSRYVLLLLSTQAVRNNWFQLEIRSSLNHFLDNRSSRKGFLVPIYIDIPKREVPVGVRTLTGIAYAEDDKTLFWTRLRKALTNKQGFDTKTF